jgi:hypothetical protein
MWGRTLGSHLTIRGEHKVRPYDRNIFDDELYKQRIEKS